MKRYAHLFLTAAMASVFFAGCGHSKKANPSGTLEATEVDIAATLGGRILEVRPDLGDKVAAGDTLVVLDTELLSLQRTQAEANRASIAAQRMVAQASLKQAEESLALAKTTLRRLEEIYEKGSGTSQQVDEAKTKRDVMAAQLTAARHQLDVLSAEENKLNAQLDVFNRQLKDGIVVAPSGGTILLRKAEPGEVAAPGAVLLRIADLSSLDLRVYLAEEDLDRVKIGQDIPIVIDALPGKALSGRVVWVSSEAEFTPKNAQTRDARTQLVYAVKVNVKNPDGNLHIGMPAEVRLP